MPTQTAIPMALMTLYTKMTHQTSARKIVYLGRWVWHIVCATPTPTIGMPVPPPAVIMDTTQSPGSSQWRSAALSGAAISSALSCATTPSRSIAATHSNHATNHIKGNNTHPLTLHEMYLFSVILSFLCVLYLDRTSLMFHINTCGTCE